MLSLDDSPIAETLIDPGDGFVNVNDHNNDDVEKSVNNNTGTINTETAKKMKQIMYFCSGAQGHEVSENLMHNI